MEKMNVKNNLPLVFGLILIGIVFRVMPHHIFNFTPVGAIALFAGAYLGKSKYSWLIPMALMLASDVLIQISGGRGFHLEMPFVYAAFAITYFVGKFGLGNAVKPTRLIGTTMATSLIFFVLTNFGSWILSPAYSKDLAGLITCYVAAIPFYNPGDILSSFALNGILGDVFFTSILFGSYALISSKLPSLSKIKA